MQLHGFSSCRNVYLMIAIIVIAVLLFTGNSGIIGNRSAASCPAHPLQAGSPAAPLSWRCIRQQRKDLAGDRRAEGNPSGKVAHPEIGR